MVIKNIVDSLFATDPKSVAPRIMDDFSERELASAAAAMLNKQEPGPDGPTSELMRTIAKCHPKLLRHKHNSYLKPDILPTY